MSHTTSSFLCLPVEIRLEIYRHLLLPPPSAPKTSTTAQFAACNSYYDYEASHKSSLNAPRMLHMRIIDPERATTWAKETLPNLKRSKCLIRTGRFRAMTMQTSYAATNNSGIEATILASCKLVYGEAAEVLYSNYTFDFDTHVEAIGAFLQDLTPFSKSFIKSMSLIKRATPYDREFDECEWRSATHSLSRLPSLRTLHLGVVAGRPGPNGWDNVPVWTKQDFVDMARWRNWAGFEWVKELARVQLAESPSRDKGEVRIRQIVEHCPPPGSDSMAFWVGVSRNVEGGFGEWIRDLIMED